MNDPYRSRCAAEQEMLPRMRALSMSLLLADNTAHNGPLMLMPGSQESFVACVGETPENHYKQSLQKQDVGVPDEASLKALVSRHGIKAPTGSAGTVVIFDCNTMHGSNGNITPYPRANAFFVFNALSNRLKAPFGTRRPRPEFIATREPQVLRPVAGLLTEQAA